MNVDDRVREMASRFDIRGSLDEARTSRGDTALASPLAKGGLRGVWPHAKTEPTLVAVEPLGGGHINDSFILTYAVNASEKRFVLQRINDAVFSDPAAVMANMDRTTTHIRRRFEIEGVSDIGRRCVTLVPGRSRACFVRDDAGGCWRMYHYIEDAYVLDSVGTPQQAEAAGRAFGMFQRLTADLPEPRLHETIPDFHHTPKRYDALEAAIRADRRGRVAEAAAEIEFARAHRESAGALIDLHARGDVPERIVHNDAKITNVLFAAATDEGLCVVDLDTVMPGLSLFDFGDMVRTMTSPTAEDETDLTKVEIDTDLFEGLARGYIEATPAFLTATERAHLLTAGHVITLEQGVRFLSDFLEGDTYYKTNRPIQNLDRCRTQFKLVESLTRQASHLRRIVDGL